MLLLNRVRHLGVSVLLLFIFWDMMKPLEQLGWMGNTHGLVPYVLTIMCVLIVDMLPISWWWNGVCKWLICFVCTCYMMGFSDLTDAIYENITAWLMGIPQSPHLEVRFLLTIFGWSVVISFLRYLLVRGNFGGLLLILLCCYYAIYQMAVGLDTRAEMVRSVFYGLLLTGIIHYPIQTAGQIKATEKIRLHVLRQPTYVTTWMLGLFLVIGSILIVGWSMAREQKVEAQTIDLRFSNLSWSNVFPHTWHSSFDSVVVSTANRTLSGFGYDDSVLGGPLSLDASIAFVAETDINMYWRGQAKTMYTGSGWEIAADATAFFAETKQKEGNVTEIKEQRPHTYTYEQHVRLVDPKVKKVIFHSGKLVDFVGYTVNGERITIDQLQYNERNDNYEVPPDMDDLDEYTVTIAVQELLLEEGMPKTVEPLYLQLPDELPSRVAELAERIVGNTEQKYEQALKVQQYLRENYKYDLTQVQIPDNGRDFVDDFLFEQKVGYCDHFSTAMAVLLRTLDIPTRWVKGFVPGQTGEGGMQTVRNLHAHSWVEAYFPERGWVLFEPTPAYATVLSQPNVALESSDVHQEEKGWRMMKPWSETFGIFDTMKRLLSFSWRQTMLGIVIAFSVVFLVVAAIFVTYQKHRKRKLMYKSTILPKEQLLQVLEAGWEKLFRKFGQLRPGQTLRQYVLSLPLKKQDQKQLALEFLSMYELARYSEEPIYRQLGRSKRIEILRWVRKL